MEIKPILKGFCPKCKVDIVLRNDKGVATGRGELYDTFFVKYDDGSMADFAICKNCKPKLDMPEVLLIQKRQRMTWGLEIVQSRISFSEFHNQLMWFIKCGALLEVVKFALTEEEIRK